MGKRNTTADKHETPLRQKYRTKGEESNGKKGTCTQPPETLAHLVGGAQTKRNIWETTEVYGVALSGKDGTTQEYLWDEQILAALYLADRTQPPIQYPQPHEKFIRVMEGIGDINAERRDGASHRRAGLGASHSMRTIRNEGGQADLCGKQSPALETNNDGLIQKTGMGLRPNGKQIH